MIPEVLNEKAVHLHCLLRKPDKALVSLPSVALSSATVKQRQYIIETRFQLYLKEFNRDFSFYTDRRIALLKKGKAAAVYEAVREYINESYETEGKALLYHDLELVLFHSKSFREKLMYSMEQDRRL